MINAVKSFLQTDLPRSRSGRSPPPLLLLQTRSARRPAHTGNPFTIKHSFLSFRGDSTKPSSPRRPPPLPPRSRTRSRRPAAPELCRRRRRGSCRCLRTESSRGNVFLFLFNEPQLKLWRRVGVSYRSLFEPLQQLLLDGVVQLSCDQRFLLRTTGNIQTVFTDSVRRFKT